MATPLHSSPSAPEENRSDFLEEGPHAPTGERRVNRAGPDDARGRASRLAVAVRGLFGRDGRESGEEAAPAGDSGRVLYARIGEFLFDNALEPTPLHYELAHSYFDGSNRKLVDAVERALERGDMTAETVELIMAECRTDMTAERLSSLVDEAQAGLKTIAGVVRQSGADAMAYGEALETSAAVLEDTALEPHQSLAALLDLTRSMIEKTREAENELRLTGKRMSALRTNLAEARRVAQSDVLTGLANRRAFEDRLKRAVNQARETHRPLALAFCDIDHFKTINDTHGHEVGDRILRYVARQLAAASGNNCFVARHGGEEFVMLFENVTVEEAFDIVEACRADLASRRLIARKSGDPIGQVTFSAGVAGLTGEESGREMLRHADGALYRAKSEGRDRVLIAQR
ncbi:diguanylate cyclase [Sphingomonas sp. SCN 67-18]|uniref:GGDEF domain-containing protein n=1 Tax=uncultured Sphingomonas sp. TaxID=158754 RepID=UPI0025E612DD|nr:GGDEF domain-containing protein [Sphingomonas sp. SCN 67-18]